MTDDSRFWDLCDCDAPRLDGTDDVCKNCLKNTINVCQKCGQETTLELAKVVEERTSKAVRRTSEAMVRVGCTDISEPYREEFSQYIGKWLCQRCARTADMKTSTPLGGGKCIECGCLVNGYRSLHCGNCRKRLGFDKKCLVCMKRLDSFEPGPYCTLHEHMDDLIYRGPEDLSETTYLEATQDPPFLKTASPKSSGPMKVTKTGATLATVREDAKELIDRNHDRYRAFRNRVRRLQSIILKKRKQVKWLQHHGRGADARLLETEIERAERSLSLAIDSMDSRRPIRDNLRSLLKRIRDVQLGYNPNIPTCNPEPPRPPLEVKTIPPSQACTVCGNRRPEALDYLDAIDKTVAGSAGVCAYCAYSRKEREADVAAVAADWEERKRLLKVTAKKAAEETAKAAEELIPGVAVVRDLSCDPKCKRCLPAKQLGNTYEVILVRIGRKRKDVSRMVDGMRIRVTTTDCHSFEGRILWETLSCHEREAWRSKAKEQALDLNENGICYPGGSGSIRLPAHQIAERLGLDLPSSFSVHAL